MNYKNTARTTTAIMLSIIVAANLSAGDEMTKEDREAIRHVQQMSRAFALIAKKVRPTVVNITVERALEYSDSYNDPRELLEEMLRQRFPGRYPTQPRKKVQTGQGSGVIVDKRGYILTNNHVVGGASTIVVKLSDGRQFPAELIGSDPNTDVAIIKVEASKVPVAFMGDSDNCLVGEWVLAIGNPFGLENTVTKGIISARGRSGVNIVEIEDFIQTDASIHPGNSGGPMVNMKGEVIGINTAILSKNGRYQGVGFAIPINIARTVMNSIIASKKMTYSYLGVRTMDLSQELAKTFRLDNTRGALVTEVLAKTPASKSGIKRGDVIVKLGKRNITDSQQFGNLIATNPPGGKVKIELIRNGKTKAIEVSLEAIPDKIILARKSNKILETLGIEVMEINDKILRRLGYGKDTWGVLVSIVERGSIAERLSIIPGSIILKINNAETRSPEELRKALAELEDGKAFTIIWRNGNYVLSKRMKFADR